MSGAKLLQVVGVVVSLGFVGAALDSVVAPVRAAIAKPREVLEVSPGAGALCGWLGGFRALAADLLWLKMHARWEERDLASAEALIGCSNAVDPRSVYFWLNGARIVAYDFPAWRIDAEGGYRVVAQDRQRAIDAEQGNRALARLALARRAHPENPALWIEQANIELNRLRNPAAAAESYRQAALQPHAPYYAARLHGELLRRLGRRREAYVWLCETHARLPRADEAAAWELVLERIRELERELAIPSSGLYQPRHE